MTFTLVPWCILALCYYGASRVNGAKFADSYFFSNVPHDASLASASGAYRLPPVKHYLVLAPRQVRPGRPYGVYVTLLKTLTSNVTVRAVLSRNDVEYARALVDFTTTASKKLDLRVPTGAQAGVHTLTVSGLAGGQQGDALFWNTTQLDYQSKRVSLFIQTDQPVYYPPQTVSYRVIAVRPEDLTPVEDGVMIYLKDARGIRVRRWWMQQLRYGVLENRFDLSYPVNVGTWHIELDAFGHTYRHPFEVRWYYFRRFEVNVTAPLHIFDTAPVLAGTVHGQHMSYKPATGNATISLRCKDENDEILPGYLNQEVQYLTGTYPFEFAMDDVRGVWPDLVGKSLFLEAWMYDWEFVETMNGTFTTKVFPDTAFVKRLGNEFLSFHPNKYFFVYFAVQRSDGTRYHSWDPAEMMLTVEVSHEGPDAMTTTEDVTIPTGAVVTFKVIPQTTDTKIVIKAHHAPTATDATYSVFRFYSATGHYLSVTTTTEHPETNTYNVFTVRTNFFVTEVYYMVTANNDILAASQLTMNSQQKTFSVALSRNMVPRAHVVVYALVEGEVIMDGMTFFIRDSLIHNATMYRNLGKDFTWNTMEMIGVDKKGSFMHLSGETWEWWRRGADTHLTEKKILEDLWEYDEPNESPFHQMWYYNDPRWYDSVYYNAETSGLDAYSTLWASGVLAITDMRVAFAQGSELVCNMSAGLGMCMDGTCFAFSRRCDGIFDCPDGYDEAACPMLDPPKPRPPNIDIAGFRQLFEDASWTFKSRYLNPRGRKPNRNDMLGQTEMKLDVPQSYNLFSLHAFFLHPDQGLTLADTVVLHNTTRWFFINCEAPSAITRGEQPGIRCALFNLWHQYIEPVIVLHGSDDYFFVNVEDFGIVSSYAPRLTAGDMQIMVPMFPGDILYIYIPVIAATEALVAGGTEITVTISGYSVVGIDTDEITMGLSYDGVANSDFTPWLVDLFYNPSEYTPFFSIQVPEQFWQPETRELSYIPGSAYAQLSVYGDVVAPGFTQDYFIADDVTGLPHNTAQGYMFDFAYNLALMRYLFAVNGLDPDTRDTALEYMSSILMRQYAYMNDDGGYRMFRRTNETCLWLTSFVLDTLHDMFITEWAEQVYIPLDILNTIALWLTEQQDPATGAFIETATTTNYNRNFGPIAVDRDGNNHTWHITNTAHVTITLAKAARLTGVAKAAAATAVSRASRYLASKASNLGDSFQMAITAYALEKSGSPFKDDAFIILQSMKRIDNVYPYWCSFFIPDVATTFLNNKFLIGSRPDTTSLSNGAMATSYALLLYLDHGMFEDARPIMKWLVTNRDGDYTWSAESDTILGVKALTEFSKRETNHQFYNMEIVFEATASTGWQAVIQINETNFAEMFTVDIPVPVAEAVAYVQGTGYAVISLNSQYRVEKPWLVYTGAHVSYSMDIAELKWYGRNASIMEMTACGSWLRPGLHNDSGMTYYTIDLPTGYVLDRDEKERIYRAGIPGLQRVVHEEGSSLYFIFAYMTTDEVCIQFKARRWYPVANTSINHYIGIIEYSEPYYYMTTGYTTYTLFNLDLCQVCGSFQCPFCPWYNAAPPGVMASFILVLVSMATAAVFTLKCHVLRFLSFNRAICDLPNKQ